MFSWSYCQTSSFPMAFLITKSPKWKVPYHKKSSCGGSNFVVQDCQSPFNLWKMNLLVCDWIPVVTVWKHPRMCSYNDSRGISQWKTNHVHFSLSSYMHTKFDTKTESVALSSQMLIPLDFKHLRKQTFYPAKHEHLFTVVLMKFQNDRTFCSVKSFINLFY